MADPGFHQPHKVAFEYLKVDFAPFLNEAKKEITAEQVAKQYEDDIKQGKHKVPVLPVDPTNPPPAPTDPAATDPAVTDPAVTDPATKSDEKPSDKPAETPADKPEADKPADKPEDKPADKPDEPAADPS
jgi:hypothetical protein